MPRPAGNMSLQIDVKELEPRVAGPHVERATVAKHHWHQPEQTSDNYQRQHERLRDTCSGQGGTGRAPSALWSSPSAVFLRLQPSGSALQFYKYLPLSPAQDLWSHRNRG